MRLEFFKYCVVQHDCKYKTIVLPLKRTKVFCIPCMVHLRNGTCVSLGSGSSDITIFGTANFNIHDLTNLNIHDNIEYS